MTETLIHFLPIVLILCLGIFVQAAAGFAAGMLIVPILMWCDYSIPAAQTALLVATIPQNIWGVWSLRDDIHPKEVMIPAAARVLFFPLGVWALYEMESLPSEVLRQVVAGFIVIATLATIVFRPAPQMKLHPAWAWITFPLSGFTQGIVGMGGPIMVFWVQAHDWSTQRSRGFLFAMYLWSIWPALAVLFWTFGDRVVAPAIVAGLSIPMLWIATHFGLVAGSKLGRKRLRAVTLALLLIIGISGLVAPLL